MSVRTHGRNGSWFNLPSWLRKRRDASSVNAAHSNLSTAAFRHQVMQNYEVRCDAVLGYDLIWRWLNSNCDWLVVWLPFFIFPEILGISSSQLTNIFQRDSNHQPEDNEIFMCINDLHGILSDQRLHNDEKSPCLMGKSTNSMAMFNGYVSLPEGKQLGPILGEFLMPKEEQPRRSRQQFVWTSSGVTQTRPLVDD